MVLSDGLVVSVFVELTNSLNGWLLVTNAFALEFFLGASDEDMTSIHMTMLGEPYGVQGDQ